MNGPLVFMGFGFVQTHVGTLFRPNKFWFIQKIRDHISKSYIFTSCISSIIVVYLKTYLSALL